MGLVRMVKLVEKRIIALAAGQTTDWALNQKMNTQPRKSSTRNRVVEQTSDSALGWNFESYQGSSRDAVCSDPRPLWTITCARWPQHLLLWLEDWHSEKSLTLPNPLSYDVLYDLQCDTQAKVASVTSEMLQSFEPH